jgi:protein-serine/threonine kinase
MQFQELPWRMAKHGQDTSYTQFVNQYGTTSSPQPLNNLMPKECHPILKHMLDPDTAKRASIEDVLKDPWVHSIEVCQEGRAKNGHRHEGVPFVVMRE